jgi:hypothetical protein
VIRPTPTTLALAGVALALGLGFAGVESGDRVGLTEARAQPCTQRGVATSVMAFFGLLEERRFYATRLLWLPRPRLPYAYVLYLHANSELLRTRLGSEIPGLAQRWLGAGGELTEVVLIDPHVNRKDPRATGYAVWWIRKARDDGELVLGTGKGVWDCEKDRIGRLVGSERPFESDEAARAEASGRCGRRGFTALRRYGQAANVCNPPRRTSG